MITSVMITSVMVTSLVTSLAFVLALLLYSVTLSKILTSSWFISVGVNLIYF